MSATELVTIRDFLRHAVSSFRAAGLVHGHGTSSVIDEAAFIILETLHLPVDNINPWLDARLTKAERTALARIIATRVKTRKPAAYLLKKTYMHGVPFFVDERVIVPRSYIGELLMNGTLGPDGIGLYETPAAIGSVLDLCTGSGCLAVLAAMTFEDATIDAVDLSKDALAVAKVNVKDHDLVDRISLHRGDLFAPLNDRRYDLIITNPPYVARAEVKAFPAEYKHEPVMAHLGGDDGFDLVRRILADAPKHLTADGVLVCEIGTGRDLLEADFPQLPFIWVDSEESEGEVFALRARDLA
ncbi:MAG: 50S ribosomal protein L3 N(5)-glutamine methyltransferase [Rhizobiales bacterium]|nr:50S ribosomal protein L3 N(5)-glutamine methyltransferase [Hyphomicrobiales bacterium]